jgi:ribosomal protein S18 acetylase RimI-like enzyme
MTHDPNDHSTTRCDASPPSAEVRLATTEDLPEIAALAREIWHDHYPGIIPVAQIEYMLDWMYSLRQMEHELVRESVRYLRLLVEGRLVGFAAYGPTSDTAVMKLHKLYVHSRQQRRGLGRLLLRHVEEGTRAAAGRRLTLNVNKRNVNAIAAYLKHGFIIRESMVADIGRGFVMDDYVMEKRLDEATVP